MANYAQGKKVINALIPGINPGLVMNPHYKNQK